MRQRLYELFNSARLKPVVVAGDVILDRYVEGLVERISPEAPVQVFEVKDEYELLGGAANVAANVSALCAVTRLVGVAGRDDNAKSLAALLTNKNIKTNGIVADPSRPTTRKTRFMAMRHQTLRVDREKRHEVSHEIGAKMLEKFESALAKSGGAIVSDYGKGALPAWLLKKMFTACKKAGKPVIVDPKGRDYAKYKGATVITPNRKEAAAATGVDIETEKDYQKAAKRIFKTTGAEQVVITRGAEGMTVFNEPGPGLHLPAEALEVFDVSGAGDTVAAVLGTLTASGFSLEDSARIANVAAAIEVGHVGAWPVSREEILVSLIREGADGSKMMTRAQAAAHAESLRGKGKKVVFTNGCFDLLHAGHIKLLKKARALGDALFVGLNTDESIRRLKGRSRPLLTETDRMEILAALDCVDAVALFGEDTPEKLISEIKPGILVKGSDYSKSQVVGREIVEKHGGRVELIELAKGKSTTSLINKIMNGNKD